MLSNNKIKNSQGIKKKIIFIVEMQTNVVHFEKTFEKHEQPFSVESQWYIEESYMQNVKE